MQIAYVGGCGIVVVKVGGVVVVAVVVVVVVAGVAVVGVVDDVANEVDGVHVVQVVEDELGVEVEVAGADHDARGCWLQKRVLKNGRSAHAHRTLAMGTRGCKGRCG